MKPDNVKMRDHLYRAIISQLLNDGYIAVAKSLTSQVKPIFPCPPSDKLLKIFDTGLTQLEHEKEFKLPTSAIDLVAPGNGIDLEFETDVQITSPEAIMYETCYVTAHKGPCRAAKFTKDGQYIATGSIDTSIKVLDVERMLAKSIHGGDGPHHQNDQPGMMDHPVIRTLYDHVEEVTCLDFHPTQQILASGSRDCMVKIFDFSKSSTKKASKTIKEVTSVATVAMHPTGDYLLVGTRHPVLRLYDLNTFQCFVSCNPSDQHKGPVTMVAFNGDGKVYATSSKDGAIKLWDGVSNRCVATYVKAHGGDEACSVQFSRNGKYLLTSGKDSVCRLWEIATGRSLIAYTGAELSGKQLHKAQAVFNHTEDYVLFPDEKTISLCCWDTRTGERQRLLSLGHNGPVHQMQHSPTAPGFITCSEDHRARFWYKKASGD